MSKIIIISQLVKYLRCIFMFMAILVLLCAHFYFLFKLWSRISLVTFLNPKICRGLNFENTEIFQMVVIILLFGYSDMKQTAFDSCKV